VTFARLSRADWVAMVAAVALLFVMAMDWYSTETGDEARRIEDLAQPQGALGGELQRRTQEDARLIAEGQEANAYQAGGGIDRVIVTALLVTIALTIAAAFLRAAGRRYDPPFTPSALAALAACAAAALVAYRILQEPGLDDGTTVQFGAPLAIVLLGVLAFAAATAVRTEEPLER
jgi:hypothetical protein